MNKYDVGDIIKDRVTGAHYLVENYYVDVGRGELPDILFYNIRWLEQNKLFTAGHKWLEATNLRAKVG